MCPFATPLRSAKAWLERAARSACSCAPAARISEISCLKAVHPLMSLKQRCIEGPPQLRLCRGLGRRRRALQDKAGAAIQLLIGAHGAHAQRQRPRASLRGCREQQLFKLWPPDACTPPAASASLVNSHPAWLDRGARQSLQLQSSHASVACNTATVETLTTLLLGPVGLLGQGMT